MKQKHVAILTMMIALGTVLGGCSNPETTVVTEGSTVSQTEEGEIIEPEEMNPETVEPVDSGASVASDTPESAESIVASPKTFVAADQSIRIDFPDDWVAVTSSEEETDDLEQSYPLSLVNEATGYYLVGNEESKTETALSSFDEYSSTLVTAVTESDLFYDVVMEAEMESVTTNSGMPGYRSVFTAEFTNDDNESIHIRYWIYTFEGENGYIQINSWGESTQSSDLENLLSQYIPTVSEGDGINGNEE